MPKQAVTIEAPKFQKAEFEIKGTAPLVIHRFSRKSLPDPDDRPKPGTKGKNKKIPSSKESYTQARYISPHGWDGFNASSVRKAMISACRLVGFKMTIAKLSVFVVEDGWDAQEPQIPLIRIYGKPRMQKDIARVQTGQPYICVRPAYHDWKAKINIRWDADQFSADDISNLLMRVGMQVGIGEGRPDSKNSGGMGWGTFELVQRKGRGA